MYALLACLHLTLRFAYLIITQRVCPGYGYAMLHDACAHSPWSGQLAQALGIRLQPVWCRIDCLGDPLPAVLPTRWAYWTRMVALCSELWLSYLDENSISNRINNLYHKIDTYNEYLGHNFLFWILKRWDILMEQTDRQTVKVTTVTLTAHARQGLTSTEWQSSSLHLTSIE